MKLSMKKGSAAKRTADDPELSPGGGVFVHDADFRKFLSEKTTIAQVRTPHMMLCYVYSFYPRS
jgi:hypothetical protein